MANISYLILPGFGSSEVEHRDEIVLCLLLEAVVKELLALERVPAIWVQVSVSPAEPVSSAVA